MHKWIDREIIVQISTRIHTYRHIFISMYNAHLLFFSILILDRERERRQRERERERR